MKTLFADTSYFIAIITRNDEFHSAALRFTRTNRHPVITSSAVILELGAWFSGKRDRPHFGHILELIERSHITIVHVDADLQERAIDPYRRRADKNWSLVDCTSFVLMDDWSITDAVTSDRHFTEAGFVALLRQSPSKN